MTVENYKKSEKIISFGKTLEKFYIILKGKVSIFYPSRSVKRSNVSKYSLIYSFSKNTPLESDYSMKNRNFLSEKNELSTQRSFDQSQNTRFSVSNKETLSKPEKNSENQQIVYLSVGDSFGESALITNNPRFAVVEVLEPCYLGVISKKDFNKILCSDPLISLEEKVLLLSSLPAFSSVSKVTLQKLSLSFTDATYNKDQVVYNESSSPDSIFFVKSGEFKIAKGEVVADEKSTDLLLKLSLMKKKKKMMHLASVVKGKNEMFGYEDLIEKNLKRTSKCFCFSSYGHLYELKIEVFAMQVLKRFSFFPELLQYLEKKYKNDCITSVNRIESVQKIEKFFDSPKPKQPISKSVQKILYNLRNKYEDMKKSSKCRKLISISENFERNGLVVKKNRSLEKNKFFTDVYSPNSRKIKMSSFSDHSISFKNLPSKLSAKADLIKFSYKFV